MQNFKLIALRHQLEILERILSRSHKDAPTIPVLKKLIAEVEEEIIAADRSSN